MKNLQLLVLLALVPTIGALSVDERFKNLESENTELRKVVKELGVTNVELQKNMGSLEKTMKELLKRLESVEGTIAEKPQGSSRVEEGETKNDTADLEVRVAALEEDVGDLEDRVGNIESINILQDQRINEQDGRINEQDTRINILEADLLDNDEDIEGLLESTTSLTGQVLGLDQRVQELESNGGGGGDNSNITDLTQRVETLEVVTSQLGDVTDILDQRVEVLESDSGSGSDTSDYRDTIFLAALGSITDASANPVIFERAEINPGGHYNPETGIYTVPSDGIYEFHVQMMAYSSSSTMSIHLYVDGAFTHYDSYTHDEYRSFTVIQELQAGQTVSVWRVGGAYGDSTYLRSYFWGRKISG